MPIATILLVEDDEHVRKLIRVVLMESGYPVLEAAGGCEGIALSRVYTGEIDLAILDIMMAGCSGLDVANQLSVERPATRILYISGSAESVAFKSLAEAQPNTLLKKPFTKKQLLDAIRDRLEAPQHDVRQEVGNLLA